MKKYTSPVMVAITFFAVYFMLLSGIQPVKFDIHPGGISPDDIYASREVVDRLATSQQQAEAEKKAAEQYIIDNEVSQQCRRDLADILMETADLRENYAAEHDAYKKEVLFKNFKISMDEQNLKTILDMDEEAFLKFRTETQNVQKELLNRGVLNVADAEAEAGGELAQIFDEESVAKAAGELIKKTIRVNKTLDTAATNAERARVRSSVPSVVYKENQIIVRRGEVVTDEQFAVLSDLGLVKGTSGAGVARGAGLFVILLACFTLVYLYLKAFPDVFVANGGSVTLLCFAAILNIAMAFPGMYGYINIYALPVIFGMVLISVLIDARLGILVGGLIMFAVGIILKANIYYYIYAALLGVCAVFIFSRAALRRGLVPAALTLCIAGFVFAAAASLLEGVGVSQSLLRGLYGILLGAITSVLLIGTLPFWENAFGIATPYKLMELSDSNQPLLKRLTVEAPGTYHHSLMVGNLAEAASEAIGKNPLLARVGAYYHDIGKLKNPMMFKENQMGENPHDKMAPELSASMIISHVKDGAELARAAKLPPAVCGIIESHHGTSLVQYFYHKAKTENEDTDDKAFRYPRRKPKTAEEAIVMLADSVEAAVRSMDERDEAQIAAMINKIVDGKLADGQLAESPLTLADINIAKNTFVKTLCGYFHSRIKYPSDIKEEK